MRSTARSFRRRLRGPAGSADRSSPPGRRARSGRTAAADRRRTRDHGRYSEAVAETEAAVAELCPPSASPSAELPQWIAWATDQEIDGPERLYRREEECGPEAITQSDVLRVLSIEAAARADAERRAERARPRPGLPMTIDEARDRVTAIELGTWMSPSCT
jgi:hypothetical protein